MQAALNNRPTFLFTYLPTYICADIENNSRSDISGNVADA